MRSRGATVFWLVVTIVALVVSSSLRARRRVVSGYPGPSPVTFHRIAHADSEPANWLTYSGQYSGQRYSRLSSVNKQNAQRLRIQWIYQLRSADPVESTPLVADGVMYMTRGNDVVALDAATGRPYWTYSYPVSSGLALCCGRQNRGLAILDGRIYIATLDAQLVALDATTGMVLWKTEIADPRSGYSSTAAPLIVKDKVITGIAGGEYGIRGFIDAYDAATGVRRWRFYTAPGPGEEGHDTWAGDSWRTGGAPTWMTGTYDPELDLIYWGTGNPGPDWNGADRAGDNLFSDSVVALDAEHGVRRWSFQFTPHDEHDWDATQVPVLLDARLNGRRRKLLCLANRNGFFYTLDRETGEFLLARPFARQTWAERIDEHGRPVLNQSAVPSAGGTVASPPANGAVNWWPPAYSPKTGLYYVTAYDGVGRFYSGSEDYVRGEMFLGGSAEDVDLSGNGVSAVRAIEPATGRRVWEFPMTAKAMSGLLATAGGVVIGGSIDGYVFALDASTGAELWHSSVGGAVAAAPMAYAVNGVEYVAVAAGDAIVAFTRQ